MRTTLSMMISLLVFACGEETPPQPRVRPEPEAQQPSTDDPVVARAEPESTAAPDIVAPAPAPEPDRAIPTSPPLPTPPSDPAHAHVLSIPESEDECPEFGDEDELSEADLEECDRLFIPVAALYPREDVVIPWPMRDDDEVQLEVKFPRFRYPDVRLARLINERIEAFARALVRRDAPGVECSGIATAQLASIGCSVHRVSQRSPLDVEAVSYAALTLRIENGEVRPMSFADAFVPGAELLALFARACERPWAEDAEESGQDDYEVRMDCRPVPELVQRASFSTRGIVVGADDTGQEWSLPGSFVVPYDDLAEHLLARGPIAEALYRRRVRTREITIDPSRRAAPPPARVAWAIGPMASPAEAAMAWSRLPIAQRDAVQYVDGRLIAPSQEAARALGTAREVRVATAARPMVLRVQQLTRDTPLRLAARRTGPISRSLPRGMVVVATGDTVDGHTRVFASADADGYVDARALGPADACDPALDPVLASLPESARANAPAATLRVLTRQAGGARAIFATELGTTIHVELHRVTDACALERAIARFDRSGARLTFLGLTHSERGAGRALIVTADETELAVHAYEGGAPIFSSPIGEGQRVAVGRNEGGVWYPVVLLDEDGERAAAFTWSGETLAPAP